MDLHLKQKVAVITGGSMGIGKAIALEFAREGSRVAVFSRGARKLEDLKIMFQKEGYPLLCDAMDVRDTEAVEKFAQKTFEHFGSLDIWVNNVGVNIRKPCMEYDDNDWETIVGINLKSLFFSSKIAAKYMMMSGGGVIINASSFTAKMPCAGEIIYSMTKAGVCSLTKTFAAELAPHNIRVVGFLPGVTETEMTAEILKKNRDQMTKDIVLRRVGQPEDMAKPVVFLASNVTRHMTGVFLEIDGGKFATQNPRYAWSLSEADV